MEPEPVVIRSRRDRRLPIAEGANHDVEISAFGITPITITVPYRDNPEEVYGKQNGSHSTQADLARVDKKYHLDLLSTT